MSSAISDPGSDPGRFSPPPAPIPYHQLTTIPVDSPPPEQEKCCTCCDTLRANLQAIFERCVKFYREI